MSEQKWTESQLNAINSEYGNLLVSAAAGSGKTAVMIERIFRLIKEKKTSADRILVVTFTNAAASSMRIKLANRFDRETEANPDDEYFRTQRKLLDRADISTIHSFCRNLVQRFYFHTPLSPDFRILDETSENLISSRAMSEILEEASVKCENGMFDEYLDALTQFASDKNDGGLCNAILQLDRYMSVMADPDGFEKRTLEFYSSDGAPWREILLEQAKKKAHLAIEYTEKAVEHYKFTPDGEAIIKDADKFAEMYEAIACAKNIGDVLHSFEQNEKAPSFYPKKGGEYAAEYALVRQNLKTVRTDIKKELQSLRSPDSSVLNAVRALFYLQKNYSMRFDDICYEEGGITFANLLKLTYDLISAHPEIKEELQNSTDYIFVDEYQDVNEIQNGIVESISKGDNLFFVGDVKQSIYSFQLASPDMFLSKMRDYANGILGKRINLSNNFRSSSPVLEAINALFSLYMHEDVAEIEYGKEDALYPSPDKNSPQYAKSLFCQNTPEAEAEMLFTDTEVLSEEEAVARRILALTKCTVTDGKTGEKRAVKYSDIVILGPTNNLSASLGKVFSVYGIPFAESVEKDRKTFDTVGAIVSLLRLLEIRRRDSDLIAVLLSAIGKFTCDELAKIRIAHPEGSFFDAFSSYGEDDLKPRIDGFFELLDNFELLQKSMALPDFISYVYSKTGFIYYVAFSDRRTLLEENMNILISSARTYCSNYSGGLRGFLEYYESISFKNSGSDVQINESDNTVHYMTVHKSKGLEFPIVILMATDKPLINKQEFSGIGFSKKSTLAFKPNSTDEYGIRTNYDSLSYRALKSEKTDSLLCEKLRLLYVALTRAKNKIIVSVALNKKDFSKYIALPEKFTFATHKNYAELLVPAMYFSPDGEKLRAWINESEYIPEENFTPLWDTVLAEDLPSREQDVSPDRQTETQQDEYKDRILSSLSWQYPFLPAISARAKQNPSKKNEHSRMALRKPEFANIEYKGAQKGTVVHFFMEHFSFTSPLSVYEQAENMRKSGLFTEAEYNALPLENIRIFAESDFAKRIANSPKVFRERSFCKIIPIEETGDEALMQGTIDCYFFENGGIVLLDYKTDVIRGELSSYVEHHRRQLEMYASALEKLYPGKTVSTYIHFFSVNKTVKL